MGWSQRRFALVFYAVVGLYYLLPGHNRFMPLDADTPVVVGGIEYRVEEIDGLPIEDWAASTSPYSSSSSQVKIRATSRRNRVLTLGQVLIAGERVKDLGELRGHYQNLEPGESTIVSIRIPGGYSGSRYKLSITPQKIKVRRSDFGDGRSGYKEFSSHSVSHYRTRWIDLGSGF
jgi:hypothetical protein